MLDDCDIMPCVVTRLNDHYVVMWNNVKTIRLKYLKSGTNVELVEKRDGHRDRGHRLQLIMCREMKRLVESD